MNLETLFYLYIKEREYQNKIFGDPGKNPVLTPNSFITFLDVYLNKAKIGMCEGWTDNLPNWFISCREGYIQDKVPIEMYEYLIKVFTLAGAALESFLDVDPEYWRKDGINPKWKNIKQ